MGLFAQETTALPAQCAKSLIKPKWHLLIEDRTWHSLCSGSADTFRVGISICDSGGHMEENRHSIVVGLRFDKQTR